MDQETAVTYRWRRREMPRIRVTWLGQVTVLMLLVHQFILRTHPMGMAEKVGLFILVVIVPVLLATLWRAGLLPPERVRVESEPPTS